MRRYIMLFALLFVTSAAAMFDNRFLVPNLLTKPFFRYGERDIHLAIQPFLMSSDEGYNASGNETCLFNIEGAYDQIVIDQILQDTGRTDMSLLRSELQGRLNQVIWNLPGRIEAQGVGARFYHQLFDYFGYGFTGSLLHANSRIRMERSQSTQNMLLGPGDEQELFEIKSKMNKLLELEPPISDKTEAGDLDFYGRLTMQRDYCLRVQRFDAGLSFGFLTPFSSERDIDNPASIPLGGNGAWGFYTRFDLDVVLKDYLRAGFDLRFQTRFDKEYTLRLPLEHESPRFAGFIRRVDVDPGITASFFPYIILEELREGFGLMFGYSLVAHQQDKFCVIEPDPKLRPNLRFLQEISQWRIEHVTAAAIYDFKDTDASLAPALSIAADIPVEWAVSERASKTYGVSCIIEFDF